MSAIASFYIFDKSALESLVSKPFVTPQKAGLLKSLSSITISRTDLQEYADDEFGEDQGEMVEALESAFNSLKSWLAQIDPGQIGILSIG